jgi:hypothetical protein
MKVMRTLALGLFLAMPATALAQGAQEPTQQPGQQEPGQQERAPMEQQQEPMEQQQEPMQQRQEGMPERPTAEHKQKVTKHVLPAKAGIDAAEGAVMALDQLVQTEGIDPKDTRETLSLAQDGIKMALDRTRNLNKMAELSGDAKSSAKQVETSLNEARKNLQQLEKRAGKKIAKKDVEQIREHTRQVHASLQEANSSLEQVARAYDVQLEGQLGG